MTYPKTVVLRKMSGPRTVVCDSLCDPLTSKFRDSWCRMYCWIFSKISPRAVTEKERDCFSDLVFPKLSLLKEGNKNSRKPECTKILSISSVFVKTAAKYTWLQLLSNDNCTTAENGPTRSESRWEISNIYGWHFEKLWNKNLKNNVNFKWLNGD